jgi:Tol biopolymer transport system component
MVAHGISPQFSPDGKQVIYAGLNGDLSAIFRYDIAGKSTHQIADGNSWQAYAVYLHSGNYISFVSDRDNSDGEFYLMASDGSSVARIAAGLTFRRDEYAWTDMSPQSSPAADILAFGAQHPSGFHGVYVYDVASQQLRQVSNSDRDAWCPRWSATGASLFFSEAQRASQDAPWDVVCVPSGTAAPHVLFSGPSPIAVLGTTMDEQSVIFAQRDQFGAASGFYMASAADGWHFHEIASISQSTENCVWSAPSESLVYIDDSPSDKFHYDLWRLNLKGVKQQITKLDGYLQEPAFSWDGREIVVDGDDAYAPRRGFGSILIAPVSGGTVQLLTTTK